ncbi:MAG TPA: ABC transporter permease subunit [Fimbriimonadaceae bacterium]|nr:ABC transporter permease subunit [Fimbriimonadaceae bacterium]
MSLWRDLVTENPMMAELSRARRRILGNQQTKTQNTILLILFLALFLAFIMGTIRFYDLIPPSAVIYLQTGLYAVFVPSIGYGAIAGERERRSWEFLAVAPLSKLQIVVGKLASSIVVVIGLAALALPPLAILSLGNPSAVVSDTIRQNLISISFGIFVATLTLYSSSRAQRSFAALGMTIGILFVLLVGVPAVVGPFLGSNESAGWALFFLHPFIAIYEVEATVRGTSLISTYWYGLPQALIYLVLAAGLVAASVSSLRRSEGARAPQRSEA